MARLLRQQGALVIDRATYVALTGDRTDAALWLRRARRRGVARRSRAIPGGEQLD
jgi:hypothetical protein